ncbi:MAG: cyclase family protein, partial [Rhodobacteraceae bacterium]|nr:cyclase family protein [Paracoccaceae bacterium]
RRVITVAHLGAVAEKFAPGESLLLRTGWFASRGESAALPRRLSRIADDLALWCVGKNVNVLGVEPPSVADVNNKEELTRIHKILLGANVTIVEGLTNLDALSQEKVFFVAAPLKIEGGDGCPCRAFAFEGGMPMRLKGES